MNHDGTNLPACAFSYVGAASRAAPSAAIGPPRLGGPTTRHGFTLVELLVVITIIGILASLITVAVVGGLRKARETEIKNEIDQLDAAFEQYKSKYGAYPPNCQIDGIPESIRPVDERAVHQNLRRHMNQAFPRHQEVDILVIKLSEATSALEVDYPKTLWGGMTAAEALVFWLGGFSTDQKYPISGEGGPSYPIPSFDHPDNRKLDPIETRNWIFPFDVARLGPRADDGYFDESGNRFLEYRDPRGTFRRINFWQYTPRKSSHPYLYFDTSRHPAGMLDAGGKVVGRYDPPAGTVRASSLALDVYAFKKRSSSIGTGVPIEFVNPNRFQILHCGLDDEWGTESFRMMSALGVEQSGKDPAIADDYLLFPDGPFTGAIADTITNFSPQTRVEDGE